MQGSIRRSSTSWLAARRLLEVGEVAALHALLVHPEIARVHASGCSRWCRRRSPPCRRASPPAPRPGRSPRPGCSNTMSTLMPLPVMSQIALPNLRASLSQSLYSGVLTVGIWPQQLKSLRLITPLAPSDMTKSRLSSSEITPMALAPAVAMSWIAIRAEAARGAPDQHVLAGLQHVRRDGRTACGRRWRASACSRPLSSQVRCCGRGISWRSARGRTGRSEPSGVS